MGFARNMKAVEFDTGEALTLAMNGIGMRFNGPADHTAHIEVTLAAASIEGAVKGDYRVLAVMTTWLGLHHDYVNVELLLRLLKPHLEPDSDLPLYWNAMSFWMAAEGDPRFKKFQKFYKGPRKEFGQGNSWFMLKKVGEDKRFCRSRLILVEGGLRHRLRDVLTPQELCRWHAVYRTRVQMSAGFRADMWAALEAEPGLSATELARKTLGSYSTAWKVLRDWGVVHGREPGTQETAAVGGDLVPSVGTAGT
ncbi:MAG: hypothetical protein ABIJ09_25610 [Pseudomonadota bacterium]